jgi:hypothetical protein
MVTLVAVVAVQAASADPVNAKGSTLIHATCNGQPVLVSGNGNGVFTPGHVVGSTMMIIPTAFDLTFSFTPTGGTTMTETNTSTKHNQHHKNTVTCQIPADQNTFTSPEGTFVISGTVTGFFTPAKSG